VILYHLVGFETWSFNQDSSSHRDTIRGAKDIKEISSLPPIWVCPKFYKFTNRNHTGDVALVPSEQGPSFKVPDIEEASTCLLGVKCALEAGIKNLIIEGDCLSLINSLKMKRTLDNFLHFIVADILSLTACFDFYSLSFVKRGATWSRMI